MVVDIDSISENFSSSFGWDFRCSKFHSFQLSWCVGYYFQWSKLVLMNVFLTYLLF